MVLFLTDDLKESISQWSWFVFIYISVKVTIDFWSDIIFIITNKGKIRLISKSDLDL